MIKAAVVSGKNISLMNCITFIPQSAGQATPLVVFLSSQMDISYNILQYKPLEKLKRHIEGVYFDRLFKTKFNGKTNINIIIFVFCRITFNFVPVRHW